VQLHTRKYSCVEVSGQNRVPAADIRLTALAAGWDVPGVDVMVIGKNVGDDPGGRAVYGVDFRPFTCWE
jgi:hypothetical protein